MDHGVIRFQAPQLPPVGRSLEYFALADDARWYSNNGPCHRLLVERLESRLGVYCVPTANATLALLLALRATIDADRSARQVLVPSFTFAATVDAVLWAGLEPVFVDVSLLDWHLDPGALEGALDRRDGAVAAVLACSTFGLPVPAATRASWAEVAAKAGVPLIIDSAAGFGAVDDLDRASGSQGQLEIFSFHATKPFAIGEGGLITTANGGLAEQLRRMANFGFDDDGIVRIEAPGLNAKMPEWAAATALATLDSFDDVLRSRRIRAVRLLDAVAPSGYAGPAPTGQPAWQFVPVRAPSAAIREQALAVAGLHQIELRSYYRVPLHRMPAFADWPREGGLEVTERLAGDMLSLPMANDLSPDAIDGIAGALTEAAE